MALAAAPGVSISAGGRDAAGGRSFWAQVNQYSDVLLAVVVCLVVGMMLIPLPVWLLDILIVINFSIGLVMLLVAVYAKTALQFNAFPSLLLITTLFRLGISIAATRLILTQAHAGQVVQAVGNVVIGGNYVVGVVVFLILIAINFMVITNGAGRVAEVAARFTLDAMPGKQMAIDADLNNGSITEDQARVRRRDIQREADFYGSMDGASKFVKGDATAAIVIMVINIVGGFIIGVLQLRMQLLDALGTYTLLTVGEGLIAQIPALMISTATGVIVTRAGSDPDSDLGKDIAGQLFSNPRVLSIVGSLVTGLGLIPGMPIVPFVGTGALLLGGGYLLGQAATRKAAAGVANVQLPSAAAAEPESISHLLHVDPISVEIGYGLISLADTESGGNLLSRVTLIRRQIATDLGVVVPTIRIRDDLQLPADVYVIRLRGVETARGEVIASRFLAMNPGTAEPDAGELDGIPTTEPAFGLPAMWVAAEMKDRAETLGYTVVDPTSVITTHLSEIVRSNAPQILGRQDVQQLLEGVKTEHPVLVSDLVPEHLSLGDVQHVLQNLLRERVSVRDMVSVLEALADGARTTRDPDLLSERVRQVLGRAICRQYTGQDGRLAVLTLSPEWQQSLNALLQVTDGSGSGQLQIDAQQGSRVVQALAREMERVAGMGCQPVLLCPSRLRLPLRRFTERSLSALAILAYNEVAPQVEVTTLGVVGDSDAL